MKFKKYNKLINIDKQTIEHLHKHLGGISGVPDRWAVTEKVHGSNLSFICDGVDVIFATRKRIVESDNFYGHTADNYSGIIEKEKILNLFGLVKRLYPNVKQVNIYGELFGGNYKHDDVDKCNVSSVQKGIYYAPYNGFYAFDICVDEEYVSTYTCNNLCSAAKIFYATLLYEGTIEECLTYPNAFKSTLSKQLGLPDVECDNICEGVVIKPIKPTYYGNGNRVMLKNKNALWSEVSKEVKPGQPVVIAEYLQTILEDAYLYINDNRLNNVISKIGVVSFQNFKEIHVEFIKDILEDFSAANKDYNKLDRKEQKIINKNINKEAARVVKNYLKQ